jgi:hypothetical protein
MKGAEHLVLTSPQSDPNVIVLLCFGCTVVALLSIPADTQTAADIRKPVMAPRKRPQTSPVLKAQRTNHHRRPQNHLEQNNCKAKQNKNKPKTTHLN